MPPTRPPIDENCRKCAGPLLAEDRQRRLGDVDDAEQVRLDLRPEVLVGGLLDRGTVRVPGVVRDHVEAAELVDSGLYRGLRRLGVGDVEGDRADRVAVLASTRSSSCSGLRAVATTRSPAVQDRPR